jgi:hypothetical protein
MTSETHSRTRRIVRSLGHGHVPRLMMTHESQLEFVSDGRDRVIGEPRLDGDPLVAPSDRQTSARVHKCCGPCLPFGSSKRSHKQQTFDLHLRMNIRLLFRPLITLRSTNVITTASRPIRFHRFTTNVIMSNAGTKPNWASEDGSFKRQVSSFRDVIEKGGKFEPEKGRYHLYVCLAW